MKSLIKMLHWIWDMTTSDVLRMQFAKNKIAKLDNLVFEIR